MWQVFVLCFTLLVEQITPFPVIPEGFQADIYRNQKKGEFRIVDCPAGLLRGFITVSARGKTEYEAYVGIPFARPPVGELRFKAPVPYPKWDGVRDALQEGPSCYFDDAPIPISEDCLYLNVFKPISTTSAPLAVMVYFVGGGFSIGPSSTLIYGPDFLMDQHVMLVTFNYRTGPLGFMSLQNEFCPGNAGLKDQREAMRWVKRNIASFGGNPNNVTAVGTSSGSASVTYHLLSQSSAGLFNQVILESGTCLNNWAYIPPADAVKKANKLAAIVGCRDPEELEECLLNATAKDLTDNQHSVLSFMDRFHLLEYVFLPTTEISTTSDSPIITTDPIQMVKQGQFQTVPVVLGTNLNEAYLEYADLDTSGPLRLSILASNLDLSALAPQSLQLTSDLLQILDVNSDIRKHYLEHPVATYSTANQVFDIATDSSFILPVQEFYKYLLQYSQANIFNYFFTFDGAFPFSKKLWNVTAKVCRVLFACVTHADELGYIFNSAFLYPEYVQVSDRQNPSQLTISRLTTMWANFAKFGQPVPETSALLPAEWLPSTPSQLYYYDIGDTLESKVCLACCSMMFWNNIYEAVQGERPYPQQNTTEICMNADGTPVN